MTNREGKLIMSTWKTMLLAGAMAFTPMQAFAAPEEAPEAEIVAAPAVEGDEGHGMNDEAMAANAKATKALKDMILAALDKAGGEAYLEKQAETNPVAFMTLIGKVLPMQVQGTGDKGEIVHRVIREIVRP